MEKAKRTLPFTLLVLAVLLTFSPCWAQTYNQSYQLLNHPDGSIYYRLNVAIPQSLYEYYQSQSHRLSTNDDFAKFVTPYALKPIADSLWQIYTDDEDFTNGVLMLVHQIPYAETLPVKYPVETLVENNGDCDLFSYVAASILKAGGLDVVLLYYKTETHMNIGVNLSHEPYDARDKAYYVLYNDVRYYVAECTGGNWQRGWRVGECPDNLKQALGTVQIIGLENSEQISPGQVSASYQTLTPSSISLTISPIFLVQGGTVTVSGQISPQLHNETIVIYVKENNSPWTILQTVATDSEGKFTYVWTVKTTGICYIRASWSGNEEYAGADSPIYIITIVSMLVVLLITVLIIIVCVGIITALMTKQLQSKLPEISPQEIPS